MGTQNAAILAHLNSGKTISAAEAFTLYGCLRLAARIYDLREDGNTIDREMVTQNGKTFAVYRKAA